MHFANEVLDHFLGHVEIGDNTVTHGADCFDGAGGAAQHQFCIFADGENFFHPVFDMIGNDGGFRKHDALAFDINQCVGRAEIDGHIRGKQARQVIKK